MNPFESDEFDETSVDGTRSRSHQRSKWPRILRLVLLFVAGTIAAMVVAIRQDPALQAILSERLLRWERHRGSELGFARSALGVSLRPNGPGLMEAIDSGDLLDVSTLLNVGVDPNSESQDGVSALRYAVRRKNIDGIYLLIARGADVDRVDSSGSTPLLEAIDQNERDIALQLIVLGADVNRAGIIGHSPLHFAADRGNLELIDILADRKANLNIEDLEGKTPLIRASSRNNPMAISRLISLGADVNIRDRGGRTALMYAVEKDNISVVNALLEAEVDLALVDNHGKSVRDYAIEKDGKVGTLFQKVFGGEPPAVKVERASLPIASGSKTPKLEVPSNPVPGEPERSQSGEEDSLDEDPKIGRSDQTRSRRSPDSVEDSEEPGQRKQMTRLRVVGKIEGVWERSKQLQLRAVRVKVRNVGDYTAEDIVIKVRVPGGTMLTLQGPTSLARNAVGDYSTGSGVSVTQGGNLKEEISCDNCYR